MKIVEKQKKLELLNLVGNVQVEIRLMEKKKQLSSKSFTVYEATVNEVFGTCFNAIAEKAKEKG